MLKISYREDWEPMIYDAFISYRHAPLDMEIAKKLHKGLETFVIPAAVRKKTGKKKIRRVFRDQEELPIGSNLDDKISSALKESEYLIVICSKETPGSYWVCKEIETFIGMHDRAHVLAILIDGEPSESFPPLLLTDAEGNPVEPLAADIRGADKAERNRKFKTELLRLAAPVIGCSFDDLRQRHRERLIRKTIAYAAVSAILIAGAGTAFGLYNAVIAGQMEELAQEMSDLASEKTRLAFEITQEFRDKQLNQSRFYAEEAIRLLNAGDRRAAALVAAEGLPGENGDRPYVAEAEYALSKALHVYDDGRNMDFYRILPHDMPVTKFYKSADGSRLITQDSGYNVCVWDMASWELCVKIPVKLLENNYYDHLVIANADAEAVYILTQESFCAYDYDAQLLYQIDVPDIAGYRAGTIVTEEGLAFLNDGNAIQMVQLSDGTILSTLEKGDAPNFGMKQNYGMQQHILVNGYVEAEGEPNRLLIWHTDSGENTTVELSGLHLLQHAITSNGNIIAISCQEDIVKSEIPQHFYLDLIRPDGERLWSQIMDPGLSDSANFSIQLKSHQYSTADGERMHIIISVEDKIFTFNEADGELVTRMALPADVSCLLVSTNGKSGYVAYNTGEIQLVDMDKGVLYSEYGISSVPWLRDIVAKDSTFVIRAMGDSNIYVMTTQKAPDLEELQEVEKDDHASGVAPGGEYFVLCGGTYGTTYDFYDGDGQQIYSYTRDSAYNFATGFNGNIFMVAQKDGILRIDPLNKTEEKISYSEMGIEESQLSDGYFTKSGDFAVFWYVHSLYVVDLQKKSCIYQDETEEMIGNALVTEDGTKLYVSESGQNLYEINIADGTKTVFADDHLREASDYHKLKYMSITPDGKYIAMSCVDQKVRIVETAGGTVSGDLPVQISQMSFLSFSSDGKYLFLEGDDRIFRIWDIEAEAFINSFATDAMIRYVVEDPEDSRLALISGYSLYYLETQDYGLCAYAPDAVAYMKDSNSFIQCCSNKLYRCRYKDYRVLLEEVERQFPGDALTSAERVDYNIN